MRIDGRKGDLYLTGVFGWCPGGKADGRGVYFAQRGTRSFCTLGPALHYVPAGSLDRGPCDRRMIFCRITSAINDHPRRKVLFEIPCEDGSDKSRLFALVATPVAPQNERDRYFHLLPRLKLFNPAKF